MIMLRARRWIVLVGFTLVAAGCGGSTTGGGGGTDGGGGTESGGESGIQGLVTPGTLTIGSCLDLAPFDYIEDGTPTGFDVELLTAVAERMGLEPVFLATNFDTIFTAVASGRFDVASSFIVVTEERQQVVDFTAPYYVSQLSLVVNSEDRPDITGFDSLQEGDTVGVQRGSVQLTWARENLEPQGVDIKTFGDFPAAFLDLQSARIDGVVGEALSATEGIKDLSELAIVENLDSGEDIAFAVPKDNPDLKEAMDQAIQDLFADGTYADIFEKHLPGVPVPTALPSA